LSHDFHSAFGAGKLCDTSRRCGRVSYPGWIDGFLEELFWKQLVFEYPCLTELAVFMLLAGGLQQNLLALLRGLPLHSNPW